MKKIILWSVIICLACGAGLLGWYHLFRKPKMYIECYNQALNNMLYGKNGAWDNVKITTTAPDTMVDYDNLAGVQIYTSETNRFSLAEDSRPGYYFYVSGLTDAGFRGYTLSSLTSVSGKYSNSNTFTNETKKCVESMFMGLDTIKKYDSVKKLDNNIFEITYSKTESGELGEAKIKYIVKVQRGKTAEESKLLEVNLEVDGKYLVNGSEMVSYETANIVFNYGAVDATEMTRIDALTKAYNG